MKHTLIPIAALATLASAYISSYSDLISSFPTCYEECAASTYNYTVDRCGRDDIDCICQTYYCEAGRQPEYDYLACEHDNCPSFSDQRLARETRDDFDAQCREYMEGEPSCDYLNEEDDEDEEGDDDQDDNGAGLAPVSFAAVCACAMLSSVFVAMS